MLNVNDAIVRETLLLARRVETHGVNVVVIVIGAFVIVRAANLAIARLQSHVGGPAQTDLEWQRRATTLGGILTRLVTVAVGFFAVLMLLRELSIDVVPILTGAGIAGLAVGFGAQNLVRDVISGFFLILEDQVRVGDLARVNGVAGLVERLSSVTSKAQCRCSRTERLRRSPTSASSSRTPLSICAWRTPRTWTA